MKRVVSSSLLLLFTLIVVAAGLYYFQRYYGITSGKAINAIPADAAFLFEADVSSGIINGISKAPYWKELQGNKFFQKINNSLIFFDSLTRNKDDFKKLFAQEKLIISAHVIKANEFDFLFLIHLPVPDQEDYADEIIKKLSGAEEDVVTRSYGDVDIKELPMKNGSTFTYAVSKNIFIGSMTAFLVEDAIRQQKVSAKSFGKDKFFINIHEKTVAEKSNQLFINYRNIPGWLSLFTDGGRQDNFNDMDHFASWSVLHPDINENGIYSEGTSFANDSSSFLFHFIAQQPVSMNVFKILPGKTAAVMAVGISNSDVFFKSHKKYLDKSGDAPANKSLLAKIKTTYSFSAEEKFYDISGNEFAMAITAPSSVNYENNAYFILKTSNTAKAKKMLQSLTLLIDRKQNEKTMQEKYNNFSIGFIRLQGLIPALYGDAFKKVNKMYYTFVGDYVVFANQAGSLRMFIDNLLVENSLAKNETFKSIALRTPAEANYFLYCKNPVNNYFLKSALSGLWTHRVDSAKNYLNKWDAFAFSVASKNKNLQTSCLLQFNSKIISSEVSLSWTAQLDTSISMKPQVVNNSDGKNHLLLIQDDAGNLNLISNSGTIIWKKSIPGKIISDIFTLDLYKNNSSEFIFNTATDLFMLDMNGNNVSNYPIHLPATATNGLVMADYGNMNDYTVYIACSNGKIYGYEGSGKPLAGWNFNNTTGTIHQSVQLFTVKGKNYLAASDNAGTVFILDPTGQIAVNVKEKIIRRSNVKFWLEEYPENNFSFVTFDTTGAVVNISMEGKVKRQTDESLLSFDNFILANADGDSIPDYIFSGNNRMAAYTNLLTLIYDVSTEGAATGRLEKYQLKNNKTVFGINSADFNKLFLFNTNGKLVKGFPVKGSTPITIDELNNDGKFYLIAGSGDGNVYVYSLE
ncbi:MAG: DUF3352 domain-containing protein [Bacteroidia bacterium]